MGVRRLRLVVLALALIAVPATANAAGTIQPGMALVTEYSPCTGSWVFEDTAPESERLFITTASHCTTRVGEVVATTDGVRFGTVFLRGVLGFAGHEDVAIVEIDPSAYGQVDPAMAGHPGIPAGTPAGPEDVEAGDLLQFSGYGMIVGDVPSSREGRFGVLMSQTDDLVEYYGPTVFGDSGGPIALRDSKRAVGIVSEICVAVGQFSNGDLSGQCGASFGPTVQAVQRFAARHGLGLRLKTVASAG